MQVAFFFLDITITHTMTALHVPIAQAPVRGNEAGDRLDPGRITHDCRPTPSLLSNQIAGTNTTPDTSPDTNFSVSTLPATAVYSTDNAV